MLIVLAEKRSQPDLTKADYNQICKPQDKGKDHDNQKLEGSKEMYGVNVNKKRQKVEKC